MNPRVKVNTLSLAAREQSTDRRIEAKEHTDSEITVNTNRIKDALKCLLNRRRICSTKVSKHVLYDCCL